MKLRLIESKACRSDFRLAPADETPEETSEIERRDARLAEFYANFTRSVLTSFLD